MIIYFHFCYIIICQLAGLFITFKVRVLHVFETKHINKGARPSASPKLITIFHDCLRLFAITLFESGITDHTVLQIGRERVKLSHAVTSWLDDLVALSALLTLCEGKPLATSGFPSQSDSDVKFCRWILLCLTSCGRNIHIACDFKYRDAHVIFPVVVLWLNRSIPNTVWDAIHLRRQLISLWEVRQGAAT